MASTGIVFCSEKYVYVQSGSILKRVSWVSHRLSAQCCVVALYDMTTIFPHPKYVQQFTALKQYANTDRYQLILL